ncbi:MAG: serine/threonine-protein kinase [Deltaproteobacteria bacterium]
MIGTTIGQLTITRQLGEGGMGAVFLAEHRVLKTLHVVKVLLPQWTQNATIVQRFVNEAIAAAAIKHRNIIKVQDCAQFPDGHWYIVMEYLDGRTLAQYATAHAAPLTPHLILHVIAQVANGLSAAHARDIVHRDLKPENIYLTSLDGDPHHVTILDFGIAKLGEVAHEPTTRTGQMAGTPAFMAPEQMRDLKSVDSRTDIYALGVITYQLATGGWLPFQDGGTPHSYYELSAAEIYHRQLTQPPIDPRKRVPTISEGWANAIMAALHPDPARRPQTAGQFAIMLAEATPGDGYAPTGTEIVRGYAKELLDIGNMLETVRAPKGATVPGPKSRYQFGSQLGAGGMAEVFRGTMTGAEGFARDVAIKRVLPGFSTMPQFSSMFVQEAQIASQLIHPNIVQVLDFDRDAEGRLFLVMELVEGKSLDALAATGPLPASVIIFMVTEVLRGLGFAHELPAPKHGVRGIVHRDVSPHNVLLSWEGAVKVSDFGIAKAREASAATASTMIKGKPGYMSPEQANGEELDGRSDLFAVGVVMWELLAARPLFVGTTHEAMAQIFFRPIPLPSTLRADVPADLEAVAMRLLERDKRARYANAEAAIADLSRCRDASRDGRGDLVRLLVERFASAIADRNSGRIDNGSHPSRSASVATARERPIQAAAAGPWATPPTTLGLAASQASGSTPTRSRAPYAIGGAVVVALGVGATFGLVRRSSGESSNAAQSTPHAMDAARVAASPPDAVVTSPDASAMYSVSITTTPPGADVFIDDAARGASPVTLSLSPGTHVHIRGSKSGYNDAVSDVVATQDAQTVALTLSARASSSGAAKSSKATKPSNGRADKGSNAKPSNFDPNEVGGD